MKDQTLATSFERSSSLTFSLNFLLLELKKKKNLCKSFEHYINPQRHSCEFCVPGLRKQDPFQGTETLTLGINKPAADLFSQASPLTPPLYKISRKPHSFPVTSRNRAGLSLPSVSGPLLEGLLALPRYPLECQPQISQHHCHQPTEGPHCLPS